MLLSNAWAWGVTNWPLQSLYGLLTSSDRVGNLGLVQVVAAGNSPLHTIQAGQLHFEPFWGLLVAALAGFDAERVLAIYPFLPLVACVGFALTLYLGLRAPAGADDASAPASVEAWSAWERIAAAAFATLLSSAPFEYAGTYRVPWAMTFLLKPNHALGFVLLPLVVAAFARTRSWRGRLGVGFLLHLLGWVFVIHMAFAAAGLVIFAVWSLSMRRAEARQDALDAAVAIGINVLIVSPYLVMLVVGYPFLEPSPRAMIPPFSPHLLEGTLKQGWIFWLGLWGAIVAARRGGRLGPVFAAQVAGGYLIWACVPLLSLLQMARERDEIYYWIRFLTAAAAGIGAFDLVRRAAAWFKLPLPGPQTQCAALLAAALPWALPCWWNPLVMDSYVPGSLQPVPDRLRLPTDFIRRSTDPKAIFAGDRDYARYVAALGARRVSLAESFHMPRQWDERVAIEGRLLLGTDVEEAIRLAHEQGITHYVVTPQLLRDYAARVTSAGSPSQRPTRRNDVDERPYLERLFLWEGPGRDFVAIYQLRAGRS